MLNFALHLVVNFGRERANQNGMRGASVGSGRHGGDVGRFEDEDSSRTSAAAGGGDVEDHWNLRIRDLFDDAASGFDKTSGSIDLDQYRLIVAALGFVDCARDGFLGDGLNGVVDDDLENFGRSDRAENQGCYKAKKKQRN